MQSLVLLNLEKSNKNLCESRKGGSVLLKIESASAEVKELFKVALLGRGHSYSPYSRCKVGAAIRLTNGQIFSGCNVENSSYGATTCAERVAVQKAVSEVGTLEISDVMVVTDAHPPWPPCGICRQVLVEFGNRIQVHTANLEGDYQTTPLKELLPNAFTPDHLDTRP